MTYVPPPQQQPPYIPPGQPAQPQKSGCFKWFAIGCSLLLAMGIVFTIGLFMFVFGAIKSTDAYKNARDRAAADPRVVAALGSPVEAGWWVMGSVHADTNTGGSADMNFPIHGPKGEAKVHAVATTKGSSWEYSELTATPEGGRPIDLLKP
jgi:hypothetical protein